MRRYTLLVVFLLFSLCLFYVPRSNESVMFDNLTSFHEEAPRMELSYTEQSPILIENDTAFGLLGFSGDGSEETPFLIDDLNITSDLECIIIRNTRVFFEITNCLFAPETESHSVGIMFENVTNAFVGFNFFIDKSTAISWDNVNDSRCVGNEIDGNVNTGVYLSRCYNCEVDGNTISGNDDHRGYGIDLNNCVLCNVTNNIVSNSYTGIDLRYSEDCIIDHNTLFNFNYGSQASMYFPSAIEVTASSDCKITYNTIYDSPVGGIQMSSMDSIECAHNIMTHCGFLIQTLPTGSPGFSTQDDSVNGKPVLYAWNQTNLIIDGSSYAQVILHEAKFCQVTGGEFNEASMGVYLSNCVNCTVTGAESSGNQFVGAIQYFSVNCTFDNMILAENVGYFNGIGYSASVFIIGSQNATIDACEISDAKSAGLLIAGSPSTIVRNNVFTRNGILMVSMGLPTAGDYYIIQENNLINGKQFGYFYNAANLLFDGTQYGQILVVNSTNVVIEDGEFSEATCGASFVLSHNCTLKNATVTQNSIYGLQILQSTNTTITKSAINENPINGIFESMSQRTRYLSNSICDNGYAVAENLVFPSIYIGQFAEISNNDICFNHYGIMAQGQNLTIYNNNISCNGFYGIYATGANFFNITSNRISGNFAETSAVAGIYISDGAHGVIRNNSIYSNSGYGIMLASMSLTNSMVYWNEIGWNGLGNAADGGVNNLWDDNVTTGNAWSDYVGFGTYPILMSSSVDNYPSMLIDSTPPIIDSPTDEIFEASIPGNVLQWQGYDDYPGTYTVLHNGTPIESRTWCYRPIRVVLDSLEVGVHNMTIILNDAAGNHVSDMIIIEAVDTITPLIDSPADIEYVTGSTGHSITWHGSDLNPQSYTIFKEGVSIRAAAWNSSSESISVIVDGLGEGEYNYTIVLMDKGGNTAIDTVLVSVTPESTPPPTTTTTTTGGPTTPPDGVIPDMTIFLTIGVIGAILIVAVFFIRLKR